VEGRPNVSFAPWQRRLDCNARSAYRLWRPPRHLALSIDGFAYFSTCSANRLASLDISRFGRLPLGGAERFGIQTDVDELPHAMLLAKLLSIFGASAILFETLMVFIGVSMWMSGEVAGKPWARTGRRLFLASLIGVIAATSAMWVLNTAWTFGVSGIQ
jgi:hypothetical protein